MSNLVEFKNSNISINGNEIINDFSFALKTHTSIIGKGASGKTIILKSLAGLSDVTNLTTLNIDSNHKKYLHDTIAVVFDNTKFICDNVYSELAFPLEYMNVEKQIIKNKIDIISEIFDLKEILKTDLTFLNKEQQTLIKILECLIWNPKVIAIDDLFIYLSNNIKNKLLRYMNDNEITLLLVTSDIEDTMYTNYIYIIHDKKVIAEGDKVSIYSSCEKLLHRIGYGLPFLPDLSIQLGLYGLLDKVYLSNQELAGDLWK